MTTETDRPTGIERRVFPMELRVERRADGTPMIVGHGAVFNVMSEDLGGFREIVSPGAFAETITQDDIRSLFNHDPSAMLGRNRSGTLKLREDGHGLAFEVTPPDTQLGRDVVALIERRDISGNSFGFSTLEDEWNYEGAQEIRTLKKVRLYDVGPVTFPAYPQTDVAMRSLAAWRETVRSSPAGSPKANAWRRRILLLDR